MPAYLHSPLIGQLTSSKVNRPGALVEVKGVELVDVCDEETKEPIVYEHNGNEYTMTEIDYHLGKVIEKMNC